MIDWPNARRGDPSVDVGLGLGVDGGRTDPRRRPQSAALLAFGRALLVNGFLSHFDRARWRPTSAQIVEMKVQDPHMSETEVARMWKVVEQAEVPALTVAAQVANASMGGQLHTRFRSP